MSPDDAAQGQDAPTRRRRRGRPPGTASANAPRTRRKRLGGADLTDKLNQMVDELIKENRKLKRQVVKLTERGSAATSGAVERSLRTIQRRVQRALTAPTKRRRRKTAASATPRKKAATGKRKKTS
jgi:hypothetical protein